MDALKDLRDGKLAGAGRLDLSCSLTEFPREIFDLADTLEVLNLTGNQLTDLPQDLGRLHRLKILFCSQNRFEHLPESVGTCPNLSMVGFKSNQIQTVSEKALPANLRWLILTDNQIEELPTSLGRSTHLQKLMLSGNRLRTLPSLARCENLEMIRIAANDVHELPNWLLALPSLSWLAIAGNPCAPAPSLDSLPAGIPWDELELTQLIGEGASGHIHRAEWQPSRNYAVKIFKGTMTSDGLPDCEVAASLTAGNHPHMIGSIGHITGHPSGAPGLVMELISPEFTPLAGPPSLDSCTRDIYPCDHRFSPEVALRIATGLASAASHLHRHGIMHGDLYAHNALWNAHGHCLLGDFGAASFYPSHQAQVLERIEVRAFGIFLSELITRTEPNPQLAELQARCLHADVSQRPTFDCIVLELRREGLINR